MQNPKLKKRWKNTKYPIIAVRKISEKRQKQRN